MTPKYTILTGATGSIGFEIARALTDCGEPLILACRNTNKANNARRQLLEENPEANVLIEPLDLTSEDSVRSFVAHLQETRVEVVGLINNAGVMNRRYVTDSQGREMTMVVNYHHTKLLTDLAVAAFPTLKRIVFTTSLTRHFIKRNPRLDVDKASFSQLGTYGRSKRAITDYAASLCRAHSDILVNCADPGVVNTAMIHMDRWFDRLADWFFRPFIRSPKHGAIPAQKAYSSTTSGTIFCRHARHQLS